MKFILAVLSETLLFTYNALLFTQYAKYPITGCLIAKDPLGDFGGHARPTGEGLVRSGAGTSTRGAFF
jgi:hypothetical protein